MDEWIDDEKGTRKTLFVLVFIPFDGYQSIMFTKSVEYAREGHRLAVEDASSCLARPHSDDQYRQHLKNMNNQNTSWLAVCSSLCCAEEKPSRCFAEAQ